MAGLEDFTLVCQTVPTRNGTVEVWPLKMRQIAPFARVVGDLVPLALSGQYVVMIATHEVTVRQAVMIGTGLDAEALDELYPDEFLALVVAVIVVNSDFFIYRLLPAIKGAVRQTETLRNQMLNVMMPGDSPSPDLSSEATALPM